MLKHRTGMVLLHHLPAEEDRIKSQNSFLRESFTWMFLKQELTIFYKIPYAEFEYKVTFGLTSCGLVVILTLSSPFIFLPSHLPSAFSNSRASAWQSKFL